MLWKSLVSAHLLATIRWCDYILNLADFIHLYGIFCVDFMFAVNDCIGWSHS